MVLLGMKLVKDYVALSGRRVGKTVGGCVANLVESPREITKAITCWRPTPGHNTRTGY